MADSNITVAGLTVQPGFSQVELTYAVTDPNQQGLPYLALDVVEVWAATANDRAHASFAKVAEGDKVRAVHSGLARGATNYYWVRAKNRSERFGDFYPAGATSGQVATEAVGGLTVPSVAGLVASGGVGLNSLTWTVTDPNASGLGDLALDVVEVHASATNDRAGATKVVEGKTFAIHNGLARGVTRYYWIRPRHINGTFGSWHPSGATSGVSATELSGDVDTSNTGYWALPSGLVMEWGNATTDGSGIATATMQRINSGVFSAVGNVSINPSTTAYVVHFQTLGINTPNPGYNLWFEVLQVANGGTVAAASGVIVRWMALGYKSF